jgi:hypothetical protein
MPPADVSVDVEFVSADDPLEVVAVPVPPVLAIPTVEVAPLSADDPLDVAVSNEVVLVPNPTVEDVSAPVPPGAVVVMVVADPMPLDAAP